MEGTDAGTPVQRQQNSFPIAPLNNISPAEGYDPYTTPARPFARKNAMLPGISPASTTNTDILPPNAGPAPLGTLDPRLIVSPQYRTQHDDTSLTEQYTGPGSLYQLDNDSWLGHPQANGEHGLELMWTEQGGYPQTDAGLSALDYGSTGMPWTQIE